MSKKYKIIYIPEINGKQKYYLCSQCSARFMHIVNIMEHINIQHKKGRKTLRENARFNKYNSLRDIYY